MQPNFLILMVDQMAGPLLDDDMIKHLHIPNMRKLIDKGVKFNNCYTPSPLCTPSRGSFMTGMLPSRNGIYDNAAEFKATTPSFAHYLRDLGYQTALSGKMHFVGPDQLHGFEERLTTDIYPADFGWTPDWQNPLQRIDWWYHNLSSVTTAGVAEISNQLEFDDDVAYHAQLKLYQYARRLDTRPFCLCVSFTHPHDPYVARQKYWDLYDHEQIPMPKVADPGYALQDPHSQRLYDAVDYTNFTVTADDIRQARHAYFANISYLDEKMGAILAVLEQCGFADNTHILLCSDHGDMLGERGLWYKMSFFEYSCRIPLVLSAAHGFGPTQVNTPVTNCDILPSLIELAGGDPQDLACTIDGSSFVGLAKGQEQPQRSAYSEYCAEGSMGPMVMIRKGQYKYTYSTTEPEQLFDLHSDPLELTNLAGAPEQQERINGFRQERHARWDFDQFTRAVISSQRCRNLVDRAQRQGIFTAWDYQPQIDAKQRFMRNHLDLNVLETNNRYPKAGS
ncbi:MAG: choline-sulfatase [Gammaproteobacteria bacterium]|nr:choline-sulfatase [Gammaproteobacteria bacterium]